MQRDTSTFTHLDSSDDDDDLPPLPSFSNITLKQPRKKTFEELFRENDDLIESQERERKNLEQIAALQIQDTLNDDEKSLPGDEDNKLDEKNKNLLECVDVLDEANESDTFEEISLRLFGELNHLQFITWDDLTLRKCGLDPSLDFSDLENLLISLNENELHEEIKCCEAFSPKNLKQLNPFVQYVFKTMSLHSDAVYVNACQKFIKKMISKCHYIKKISISYADIFMVLFNYGVDVRKDIFNTLPGSKEIRKSEIVKEIPKNWMFNLKAVLSSIGDLMKHCKMKEDDLFNIFIYLLWMSMDDYLNINMALQLCTETILCKFSTVNWPVWRLKIVQFVISSNQYNLILKMIKCIMHHETPRGVELRNYLSYIALRKLTDGTSDSNVISKYFIPKYSEKLFCVKNLQPILKSICDMKKSLQLVAIKFINLFTMSLKLCFKEEHSKLLISLKKCENSISMHATVQQSRLCIIHSRISTLTPCESMKQMFDAVEKQEELSDDEDVSMHDPETDGDTSQSPLDDQSFSEEPRADIASYASNDRSQKQNATLQSIMFDAVEKQEEISDDKEDVSMHDPETDGDTSQSPLDEQSFSEEPRAGIASYASNDRSQKQNATLQSIMFDAVEKQEEISDDKEDVSMHDPETDGDTSQSPLDEQSFSEEPRAGIASYASNDRSQKQNATLQSIMFDAVEKQEEISDDKEDVSMHDPETDGDTSQSPLDEQSFSEEPRAGIASYASNDRSQKQNATLQSIMFDAVEKQEEISDDKEDVSMHDPETDGDTSQSPLDEQSFSEEPRAGIASYASNDRSQKQNATLQSIMFDAVEKQEEISDDKEDVSMHDPETDGDTSQSPLDEQSFSEEPRAGIASYASNDRSQKQNATLQSIITYQDESEEIIEELPSKEKCATINPAIASQSLLDEPLVNKQLKELIVNSAILNPETNSNVELETISERLVTESDRETETSSERENYKSDEEMNSGRENYVTPSKSFLIDHRYARKEWTAYSPVNPSKNLNTCFDKLAQSNDQCENKLLHSTNHSESKNMLEIVHVKMEENSNKNSATCVKTVPRLNSDKTLKKYAQDSFLDNHPLNINKGYVTDSVNIERSNICPEHCFNILSAGVVSAEDQKKFHRYQNSSAVQTANILDTQKVIDVDSNFMKQVGKNPAAIPSTPINVHLLHKTGLETLIKAVKPVEETTHINTSSANSLHIPDVKKSADAYSQSCSIVNPDVLTFTNKSEEMRSSFMLDSENHTSAESIVNTEVSHSLCTEISQMEIQNDSFQSKTLQNLISSQSLNSFSTSENSRNDGNVISNLEHCDKVKPSELIRSNEVDNTEAAFINSAIEEIISEIKNDSAQNKTLQNPTSLQNLIPCSVSENSRGSMNDRNVISNIEHCDKVKLSESIRSNEADNTEATFIDSDVEKIISVIDSAENKTLQNLTSLPNLISCAVSENSSYSINNRNVISNIEHCDKVKPSELIREVDNTEAAFVDSAIEKIISEIQNNSAESETLQNPTSLQNLIPCSVSENSRDSVSNTNVISNIELIDKMKPSELIRFNEVDNIEASIGSIFEKNISEITHKNSVISKSSSLPLSTKNSSNIHSSSPEELTHLRNNTNICDKKCESVSKANAENIHNFPGVFILPPSTIDASESFNNDAEIVPKFLNVENEQNVVGLQPKDIPISSSSVYIDVSMHPSTRSDVVKESNSTKNVTGELFSGLIIPEVKKTGSAKVSSDDSTTTKKLTSIMPERNLDPLYCDMMVSNPNPLDILINTPKKSKEDGNFIPRSVHIKTAKTMHSSDLRVGQSSKKESTSNFQNLVQNSCVEKNEIFNTSERNNSVIDADIFSLETKMDIKRREIEIPSVQISQSNKTVIDKAEIDMFNNESATDERVYGTSFQPNIVHLRAVKNIKDSDIGKINSSDGKKHKKFCTPPLNNILGENRKSLANNGIKPTTKSEAGFNFYHDEPSVEHQNIAFPLKRLSQAGASSKIQPLSVEFPTKKFPNTSCPSPKRKDTDSISHLTSKRPRIPERLHLGRLAWAVNFPASSSPAENLSRQKEAEMGPVGPLANNSSSVYYTEICNSQLANEIPATRESSEVITDHSSNTEHIKNQYSKNLSDPDSGSSSDSESSSSDSKLQSKILNINKNSLKDSQCAVVDFVESISSDSEDEILVIEEITNIKTNAKNKYNNSLPSPAMDKRRKYTSLNSMSQMPNQNSVKTPTKPKQSSQTKYFDMPRNRPISLYHFLEDECTDNLRIPKKSVKPESRTTKKSGNPEQRARKNLVSNPGSSSVKKPRLAQTSLPFVPHVNTCPKASSSCNQEDDDIQCLDSPDTECRIIAPDSGPEIITVD